LCGTAEDVVRVFRHSPFPLLEAVREFRLPSVEGLGDALMAVSPQNIQVVQELIEKGLIARPTTDAYPLGVFCLRVAKSEHSFSPGAADWIERDPGFAGVLLRLLEIEGNDDQNLALSDRRNKKGEQWSDLLRGLVERGVYSRALVQHKLLTALGRGWVPYRAQWFSAFHDSLGFSAAEMAPHAARYLALVTSNSPATVALALDAVKTIDDAHPLDARELLEGVSPALSLSGRTHVKAALILVDAVVSREPTLAADAAQRIAMVLAHESADVQGLVLKRLAKWPMSDETRALLVQAAKTIAAIHRPMLAALAGDTALAKPPARAAPAARIASDPLDPAVRIEPVETADALVECVQYFLENDADLDEFERAIAGLVRLAPFDNATRARLETLAIIPPGKWVPAVSGALQLFIQFLLTGRPVQFETAFGNPYPYRSAVDKQLCQRLDELMEFSHRHPRCPPLSTPTHARGFIDPAVLVERLAAYRARGTRPGPWDAMLAIQRLAPLASTPAIAKARALGADTMAHAVRFALGDEVVVGEPELRRAAARIRAQHMPGAPRQVYRYQVVDNLDCPGLIYDIDILPPEDTLESDPLPPDESMRILGQSHRPPVYRGFAGNEAPLVHYCASLLPADPEGFFSCRVLNKVNREDVSHDGAVKRAYLLPLLNVASLGPMGTLLIVVSLGAAEADHVKLATDALLRARSLGILDADRIAGDVRTLAGVNIVSPGRLVKAFGAMYAQDPHVAPLLLELLGAIIAACPTARLPIAPRDITAALGLMVEMVLARSLSVPGHITAALAELKIGAKGSALRAQLLAPTAG
jgi:hypothetical protein